MRWARTSLAFAIALGGGACAKRTDAETKAAFIAASRQRDDTRTTGAGRGARPPPRRPNESKTAWQGVNDRIAAAIRLLGKAEDAAGLVEPAIAWCAVRPEPRTTEGVTAYVCFLGEPLEIDKRSFALSVFPSGVIGLQMDELDDVTARALAERATTELASLCATPFVAAPNESNAPRSFSTCPVDGGATLAIGYARASTGPGWFVSLSVLGQAPPPPRANPSPSDVPALDLPAPTTAPVR